ncbi:hypothetical protein AUEXF2481DRAFT_43381 [Aureobasidium subglaciale EXF-2481]|uniref:Fungal N-terminal domain-containing protein n=1 Tax=Aureobasidium subglaciale (strain EXF-2481) TaxID=1043005 RepID=A0A074YCX5_AURSE|nr:uncharacterized protein AUEXF2481DRAFT_43381 [Aureobasidium subglaciale EXF-2481]KEQ91987.1 hypothetical protein AUEXF2481DRAFT_43381 [Aureobasidium subglaciale EXF-2481]
MVVDGGAGAASAIGSAVNISIRLFQVIYEFKAVGQQTKDLLSSTNHVSATLESAQTLLLQKSAFLGSEERKYIDSVLADTKRCLETVAALVEPARVDMQIKDGHVDFVNKGLFVFRDSPKVANSLARLSLVHQSLSAVMGILCSKEAKNLAPEHEIHPPRISERMWLSEYTRSVESSAARQTPMKARSKGRAYLELRAKQWQTAQSTF